jgi:hypothetical protein
MAMHTRATPGVYAIERSSRVFTAIRPLTSIFPPNDHGGIPVPAYR